jgi:hypothetical protein
MFLPKIPKIYNCKECDYNTSNKKDYKKHIETIKHIKLTQANLEIPNYLEKTKEFVCNCGNSYKHASSLSKHKKKCQDDNKSEKSETDSELSIVESNTMVEFMKQNQEFQKEMFNQMMEFMRTQCNNNINNGTINNTNNTQFNLQLYLNETCKNAMTIDEFIDYLQPTVEELEATARLGYVEGITRIIMRGLKDLEEELRPFHCTDLKRESLFIKNSEGIWEKETDEKPLLLKFVKAVGHKNFKNLREWQEKNPSFCQFNSKTNDMFNQILVNSMSGSTEEEQKANYEKIMKNIAREVVIDKSKKNKKK